MWKVEPRVDCSSTSDSRFVGCCCLSVWHSLTVQFPPPKWPILCREGVKLYSLTHSYCSVQGFHCCWKSGNLDNAGNSKMVREFCLISRFVWTKLEIVSYSLYSSSKNLPGIYLEKVWKFVCLGYVNTVSFFLRNLIFSVFCCTYNLC